MNRLQQQQQQQPQQGCRAKGGTGGGRNFVLAGVTRLVFFIGSIALVLGTVLLPVQAKDDDQHSKSLVTYGSAIQLRHKESLYYLNSEEKNLNSGSGQQIVTAIQDGGSHNTLWLVRPKHDNDRASEYEYYTEEGHEDRSYQLARPVKCGDVIRLTHLGTGRNLHSHGAESPLSRQQEVTAFGEGDMKGDAGDNFVVTCSPTNNANNMNWRRGDENFVVWLRHVDTNKLLGSSKNTEFNVQTCGRNCPIMGHLEVFGRAAPDKYGEWYADGGIHLSM